MPLSNSSVSSVFCFKQSPNLIQGFLSPHLGFLILWGPNQSRPATQLEIPKLFSETSWHRFRYVYIYITSYSSVIVCIHTMIQIYIYIHRRKFCVNWLFHGRWLQEVKVQHSSLAAMRQMFDVWNECALMVDTGGPVRKRHTPVLGLDASRQNPTS